MPETGVLQEMLFRFDLVRLSHAGTKYTKTLHLHLSTI